MDLYDAYFAAGGFVTILIVLITFLVYLLPVIIISNVIKNSSLNSSRVIADALTELAPKDSVPVFLPLVQELTYYFDLGDNVFVPKRYYNLEENYYNTPVGAFVPVYEEDNTTIIGFLYKK